MDISDVHTHLYSIVTRFSEIYFLYCVAYIFLFVKQILISVSKFNVEQRKWISKCPLAAMLVDNDVQQIGRHSVLLLIEQ
jgi:hypothetical protein